MQQPRSPTYPAKNLHSNWILIAHSWLGLALPDLVRHPDPAQSWSWCPPMTATKHHHYLSFSSTWTFHQNQEHLLVDHIMSVFCLFLILIACGAEILINYPSYHSYPHWHRGFKEDATVSSAVNRLPSKSHKSVPYLTVVTRIPDIRSWQHHSEAV